MSVNKTVSFHDDIYQKIQAETSAIHKFSPILNEKLRLYFRGKYPEQLFICPMCKEAKSEMQFEPCYDCMKKTLADKIEELQKMVKHYQEKESKIETTGAEKPDNLKNERILLLKSDIKRNKKNIRNCKSGIEKTQDETMKSREENRLTRLKKILAEREAELQNYGS